MAEIERVRLQTSERSARGKAVGGGTKRVAVAVLFSCDERSGPATGMAASQCDDSGHPSSTCAVQSRRYSSGCETRPVFLGIDEVIFADQVGCWGKNTDVGIPA